MMKEMNRMKAMEHNENLREIKRNAFSIFKFKLKENSSPGKHHGNHVSTGLTGTSKTMSQQTPISSVILANIVNIIVGGGVCDQIVSKMASAGFK